MTGEIQGHAVGVEPPSIAEIEEEIVEQRHRAALVRRLGPAGEALADELDKGVALLERLLRAMREAERRMLASGANPHHKPGHA